ncbi:MAG: TetR/AcrR family transcriptional regulator [Bacteroidetes bacterium]|nr:TetR/AcrR family transcriptional regulator [Bacteroidota bacterium]MCW5896334.1 TetR/AcrR family transcriptional regulator [Bacteroidota bacterium]
MMNDLVRQPLVRKERERLAKRQEIVNAARQVFAQKGYDHATLDEIAAKAEFAKGTLYNYFDSKETLFREIVSSMLDDLARIAQAAMEGGGSLRERFLRYAIQTMEYHKKNEDLQRILARELNRMQLEVHLVPIMQRLRSIAEILGSALKREINKRTIVREEPIELAFVFLGMVHNRTLRRSFEGNGLAGFEPERDARFLVQLFFEGCEVA